MYIKLSRFSTAHGLVSYKQWEPDNREVRAVVQLVHGMMEHVGHYDTLATYLTQAGYALVAHDQKGHGQTAVSVEALGIVPKDSWTALRDDCSFLFRRVREEFPDQPYFLLGHSMGAVLVQDLLKELSPELRGVILSAPPSPNSLSLAFARFLSSFGMFFRGADSPASLIHKLSFGACERAFSGPFSWLSRDADFVKAYSEDSFCGFVCSYAFYKGLFQGFTRLRSSTAFMNLSRDLSCLFLGGALDPLLGKDASLLKKRVCDYESAGFTEITMRIYPESRHALFQESNLKEIARDLITWLGQEANVPLPQNSLDAETIALQSTT